MEVGKDIRCKEIQVTRPGERQGQSEKSIHDTWAWVTLSDGQPMAHPLLRVSRSPCPQGQETYCLHPRLLPRNTLSHLEMSQEIICLLEHLSHQPLGNPVVNLPLLQAHSSPSLPSWLGGRVYLSPQRYLSDKCPWLGHAFHIYIRNYAQALLWIYKE